MYFFEIYPKKDQRKAHSLSFRWSRIASNVLAGPYLFSFFFLFATVLIWMFLYHIYQVFIEMDRFILFFDQFKEVLCSIVRII